MLMRTYSSFFRLKEMREMSKKNLKSLMRKMNSMTLTLKKIRTTRKEMSLTRTEFNGMASRSPRTVFSQRHPRKVMEVNPREKGNSRNLLIRT